MSHAKHAVYWTMLVLLDAFGMLVVLLPVFYLTLRAIPGDQPTRLIIAVSAVCSVTFWAWAAWHGDRHGPAPGHDAPAERPGR